MGMPVLGEDLRGPVHDLARTGVDGAHGLLDQRCAAVLGAQLPEQVVGVARDAVPADARSREEGEEPVGLGGRRLHHLEGVEVEAAAHRGELVGEGDVDRPERVLVELRHLGGGCAADDVDGRCHPGDVRHGLRRAVGCPPADDAGHPLGREGVVGGVDPLGAEGDGQVAARLAGPSPRAARPGGPACCRRRSSRSGSGPGRAWRTRRPRHRPPATARGPVRGAGRRAWGRTPARRRRRRPRPRARW